MPSSIHPNNVDREFERLMRLGYLEGPFEHGSRGVKIVNSIRGVPKKDAPDKPRMCVNLTGSKVNEKLEFIKFLYTPRSTTAPTCYTLVLGWKRWI